ncbi:MAG: hypothetical protein RIT27_2382 [Pseudomonadota bacterium]|jgi:glycosyltransferase involved in cell wall biosynthesis
MKFVLLCKRYYTNKDLIIDQFGRLFYLPVELKKLGLESMVIAADYRNPVATQQEIEDITFHSIPLNISNLRSFLSQTNKLIQSYQPDFLMASGDTHFGFIAYLIAKKLKIPFVFDMYDFYPAFGTHKLPFMKTIYYFLLKRAHLVVCASEPLKQLTKKYNSSVITIENGVDTQLFKHLDKKIARQNLRLPLDIKMVGFFGSLTERSGPQLVHACEIVKEKYPNLLLLLAGKCDLDFEMLNKPWIKYAGFVSQREVVMMINACDVVTLPYELRNNGTAKQIQMSNACKIAEYLACEVPIVSTRVSNYMDFFKHAPQSFCEANDSNDMANSIILQLEMPQIEPFPQNLTWQNLSKKLFQRITQLFRSSS